MAEQTSGRSKSGFPALAITDELSRARSFVLAAHMAANALNDDQERDALQEVLDAAEKSIAEARRLATRPS